MLPRFGQRQHGWSLTLERPNMDVQRNSRDRVFSILNDNDCPSFVIKQKQPSPTPPPQKLPSIASLASFSPRIERPNLFRHPQFHRNSSISSTGSPPLLRHDSASSSKSSSSMDSTPSPITPAYNYNDTTLVPYDSILRQDPTMNYLPSPTGITPFIEQGMMIGPVPQNAFHPKTAQPLAPAAYPPLPAAGDLVQMPTPALSADLSVSSSSSASQPSKNTTANNSANANTGKKNKYPCPYAQSHNCSATFTTSGHAARHGKKHTGEKGVHCPICDKAFTRKDNMKQHERTHKNRPSNGEEKKSKAQATREANKAKDSQKQEQSTTVQQSLPPHPAHIRKSSSGISEPSDMSLAPNPVETPTNISPSFFPDTNPQIILPGDTAFGSDPITGSMYPPLIDEAMLTSSVLAPGEKLEIPVPQPPALVRGFSDLDTLAQAAESAFEPYFQPPQF